MFVLAYKIQVFKKKTHNLTQGRNKNLFFDQIAVSTKKYQQWLDIA
jgi:hypothetical protein